MGTHQVRWMALDHKYGSWFDYMEPHVKPTAHPRHFRRLTRRLFPSRSVSLSLSHVPARVSCVYVCVYRVAFYPPAVAATLPAFYPDRDETLSSYRSSIVFAQRVVVSSRCLRETHAKQLTKLSTVTHRPQSIGYVSS